MPIYDKRDKNSWYSSIRTEESPTERMRHYYAENIKGNEIRCGDAILAKLPEIPGRIGRRNVKGEFGQTITYIEFILDRYYDKEKHQSRNKRVIIGTDVSNLYHGMMMINDRYHDFFDRDGNLIYEPEQKEEPLPEPQVRETEVKKKNDEQPHRPKKSTEETKSMDPKEPVNPQDPETGEELPDDNEDQEQHVRDYLDFLDSVLNRYIDTIEVQAKKRPDKHLSLYQTRRINQLLSDLRYFFGEFDTIDYLQLAEEPDVENPETTGVTYADMAILLASYVSTMYSYKTERLWTRKKNDDDIPRRSIYY